MSEIWTAVAGFFDVLATLGALIPGLAAFALGVGSIAAAWGLQRRLVHLLSASPQTPVSWWRLEQELSLPGLLWKPFVLLFRKLLALVRTLRRKFHREAPPAPAAPAADNAVPEPLLVASLGPSYLLGGLITAGLYALTRLVEPLLRVRLDLAAGVSPWQLVLLGHRPEMAPHLPLDGSPHLAALLALVFWMAVAAWASRAVRFFLRGRLGRNLAAEVDDQGVLPFWRRQAGAMDLFRPDVSYTAWASWVVAWAFPLLVWAWLSLNGSPWRVAPGEFAVAFVLWLSWATHLLLRGVRRIPSSEDAALARGGAQANGWPELLVHLRERLQVAEPYAFQAPRAIEPLQLTNIPPELEGVLSPLVLELLPPGERRLTVMQRMVLTDLALQGFVHVEPPVSWETLELSDRAAEAVQDRSGLRHRNQIVIAPESAGKTTLALLAAANHALVHTRSTLVIARDEEHETEIYERFRGAIEPSTVRWNIRVRRVGGDLVNDLTLGIVPDVIVCSLQGLVVHLLGQSESFVPFLQGLGLIVVDDVELFEGPVEVHAQLAFRRLTSRVRQLVGVHELGERSAPLVLVLGGDSMHDLGAWAQALCGIDAVVRDFTGSQADQEEREAAELAARGFEARPSKARDEATEHLRKVKEGPHQVFYRLRDFRTAADEPLSIGDLITASEQLAIPWCYRPCGDRRRRLGRLPLRLRDEPKHCVDSPECACVIFLEGRWSEVWRERQRLRRAGARFTRWRQQGGSSAGPAPAQPEPIAMITLVDPDEDMAFTQLDRRFGLAEILDGLPEPVLRPPTGDIVQSHLAADLVQHWLEVAEVLGVFGHATAHTLRRLSRGGMLLLDRRTDVHPDAYEYVQKVYVRALARATAPLVEAGADGTSLLPSRVSQVELVSPLSVTLRDRTRPSLDLGRMDAAAASFLYYPGRIFTDARGSFVVVGRATDEAGKDGAPMDIILMEPILTDEVSSPRRRIYATPSAAARARVEGQTSPPEAVLFGRLPFRAGLLALEVRVDHVATYRLAPATCEVRQRLLRSEEQSEEQAAAAPLLTRGLMLYPNPDTDPGHTRVDQEPHPLRFAEARLLAAALRVVLPSMYRGGADGMEVGLLVEGDPEPDHELDPTEGFLLFEVADGGNGMAQAVHRDGLEALLRLCRLLIERVLYPDRLLALHDHWGDKGEILASSDLPSEIAGQDAEKRDEAAWDRYQAVRQGTLTWLDQHLRPEGRADGSADGLTVPGVSSQPGEGDAIDIGRCWFSHDGAVNNLVWAKHRWRLPWGSEAMLDVGFDRAALAAARQFTENTDLLALYTRWHAAYLQISELRLPDGTVWGAPCEVWLPTGDGRAERSREGMGHPAVPGYHAMAEAIAAHGWPILQDLAETLGERSQSSPGSTESRLDLAKYLSRFVQGIPYSVPGAVSGGLRPPVSLLLHRLGDCDSKSLLLALLARHCGIDAGLFVSFDEGHAMAALALPDPGDAQPSGDDKRPVPPALEAWSTLARLPRLPRLWAEMPASPEAGAPVQIYVPVESTAYSPLGGVSVGKPGTWAFLPLTAMRFGIPSDDSRSVLREDRVELESR